MTANQMADELELKLDRSSSYASPGYEDFELSSVLTEAQTLYVKKYYDELNNIHILPSLLLPLIL